MSIKFSDFAVATGFGGTDFFPVVQSGVMKQLRSSTLWSTIVDPVVMNSGQLDVDTRICGVGEANLVFVDASTNRIGLKTSAPGYTLDVNGDIATRGRLIAGSKNTQTTAAAVSLTTLTTIVDVSSSTAVTIGAGVEGQYKQIFRKGSGTVTITASGTTIVGATTITMTAAGAVASLQYLDGNWYLIDGRNLTIA